MQYNTLGRTGIKVSELCFGTMSFGGDADKVNSKEMFNRCRDEGINFFDCADIYNGGVSEQILGDLISDCRNEIILTSKVYFAPENANVNESGSNRKHIILSVEKSLKRLKTDYIDFYFIHRFDNNTPLLDTLRTLDMLVQDGKILYPAVSNYAAWQIAIALGISAKENIARFECIQPMYNLIKRQAEVEILDLAKSQNLGVISYSPLGSGLLTGKYFFNKTKVKGRLVENKKYGIRYGDESMEKTAIKFIDFAKKLNFNPVSLAIAWVASHPAITAPIIGARSVKQLEDSLNSTKIKMDSELRNKISALSIDPPIATDRNEETKSF